MSFQTRQAAGLRCMQGLGNVVWFRSVRTKTHQPAVGLEKKISCSEKKVRLATVFSGGNNKKNGRKIIFFLR